MFKLSYVAQEARLRLRQGLATRLTSIINILSDRFTVGLTGVNIQSYEINVKVKLCRLGSEIKAETRSRHPSHQYNKYTE